MWNSEHHTYMFTMSNKNGIYVTQAPCQPPSLSGASCSLEAGRRRVNEAESPQLHSKALANLPQVSLTQSACCSESVSMKPEAAPAHSVGTPGAPGGRDVRDVGGDDVPYLDRNLVTQMYVFIKTQGMAD